MSSTGIGFLRSRSRLQSGLRSNSCLSNNSKTTEANLMKLHRKIENDKKVCRAQELCFHIQGQGHNQGSEVKSFLCDYLKLAEANFVKLSKKVNHKVKVTIWGQSLKYVSAITQKSTKANFIKLHRKIRHHERYAMHHSQRLKVKSFLCISKKLLKQI